jgi:D-alanyl-D-alanine dipeptidase
LLTKPAAEALADVQKELVAKGYSLKVYDCYRPQKAVDDFVAWSEDVKDPKNESGVLPTRR